MSKPSGEVIETPITSNFREGLSALPRESEDEDALSLADFDDEQ